MVLTTTRAVADATTSVTRERMFEKTFKSKKAYEDPFNDIDVDVIFTRAGRSWRVPCFWRGGQKWTVRFAPPASGVYSYRLESTDLGNPDLNGVAGTVEITSYGGSSSLLRRGPLRVSANGRFFEHSDGTPFYWLGDTWWTGLSDRLSWDGFRKLTSDRKAKGFTLVQIVAGLVPLEDPPSEPGFCNEGGCVWSSGLERINPQYFDYADRRIQWLVENDMVPAIVGAWNLVLRKIGVEKMKKHWRYIVARYGAYPVIWIVGGEVLDPPHDFVSRIPQGVRSALVTPGWTEVATYVRDNDPYRHPLSVHELPPPLDFPVNHELLTDFDLFQSGQLGWPSIAFGVEQLNSHYARSAVIKPVVQGEIGYENHFYRHFDEYQRTAFWLSMLNGAAGHTYGADATWGAYSADRPLPTKLLSLLNWEEGMNLPGSYQVGLGSKLLREYQWWRFQPHPEWVVPHGTTFLETGDRSKRAREKWMSWWVDALENNDLGYVEIKDPSEEEARDLGSFDRPYAAGVPGEIRIVYVPVRRNVVMSNSPPPTILGLEAGVCYSSYLWEPQSGIRLDLGTVQRPSESAPLFVDDFGGQNARAWEYVRGHPVLRGDRMTATDDLMVVRRGVSEADVLVETSAQHGAFAALLVRYQDPDNFIAAVYSAKYKSIYLLERRNGVNGRVLGKTPVPLLAPMFTLSVEVRKDVGAVSAMDGIHKYTTPIVDLVSENSGSVGLMYVDEGGVGSQSFEGFKLRRAAALLEDAPLPVKLYDARGQYRGELSDGRGWGAARRKKHILLDAYRPEELPTPGDWVLVMDATVRSRDICGTVLTSSQRAR